jgi:hypothetical protein
LAYLLELIQEKEFIAVALCFFEAYHGKSEVDSMFGILTGRLDEWVKMRYLNTTEDILNCFQQNVSILPFLAQIFFWNLSIKRQPEKFKIANKIKVKLNSKCNDNSLFKSFWDFQSVIS